MKKLTIEKFLEIQSIEASALSLLTKITYNMRKGYTQSHDGETFWEFGAKLNQRIKQIKRGLQNKNFVFKPCLQKRKRTKSKVRKIYISTWADKIVERWLNDCINKCLHSWFSRHSYAYRMDKLGIDTCQNRIIKAATSSSFIIRRDITSYFYSIDHDILLSKLRELVDENNFLFDLIRQRIQFQYFEVNTKELKDCGLGLPFGSAIACTLSNLYLTDLDNKMAALPVEYFRYADDFLIAAQTQKNAAEAAKTIDEEIIKLKLQFNDDHRYLNASFEDSEGFNSITKFKFLGLEFTKDGTVRLPVEKQRKVINFFKREMERQRTKLSKIDNLDKRIEVAVKAANTVMKDRIRSIAIVDYYLKHINDEQQLKILDRLVAEHVICAVLGRRKFRKGLFRIVPFKKLREKGLISILHRCRLHRHGHLKVSFMSIHNELVMERYLNTIERRKQRINHMKLAKKLKKDKQDESNNSPDQV